MIRAKKIATVLSKITAALFLLFILVQFVSCYGSWNFFYKGNNVDERTQELRLLTDSDSRFAASGISELKHKYTVLIISDTHFGNTKKKVDCERLYNWLESVKGTEIFPSFAICLGDSTDLGKQSHFDEYLEFCGQLEKKYGISLILNSCGNHDIYQSNWDNWEKNCYPHTSFYKFQTEKLSWYCLDTASGTFGLNQYNRILEAFSRDNNKKIIFTHYPFIRFNYNCANMAETTERNKLISDFSKNKVLCVLGGHNHKRFSDDLGFMDYGLPSFAYSGVWGLLNVNEDKNEAWLEYIGD